MATGRHEQRTVSQAALARCRCPKTKRCEIAKAACRHTGDRNLAPCGSNRGWCLADAKPRSCILDKRRSRLRGLTPRSSGAATAGHQARAGGTPYIFTGPGLASRRRRPLSSNVRLMQNSKSWSFAPSWRRCTLSASQRSVSGIAFHWRWNALRCTLLLKLRPPACLSVGIEAGRPSFGGRRTNCSLAPACYGSRRRAWLWRAVKLGFKVSFCAMRALLRHRGVGILSALIHA